MTDVEYLKTEFEKFRRLEITVNELCERDFIKLDGPPQSGDERIARLADANGFDGNLFRDLFAVEPFGKGLRDLREKICILPRLIAKIETELPPANPHEKPKNNPRTKETGTTTKPKLFSPV